MIFPVLGNQFSKQDFGNIPLSIGALEADGFDVSTYERLDFYIKSTLFKQNKRVGYGGYGERRGIYAASPHFKNDAANRNVHLGIDLWAAAGTAVFAPLDGTIHSFRYNDQPLDYGATIITEHHFGGEYFWLLFGHLSLASLENIAENAKILRGQKIAELGNRSENGGWVPHLHLQKILDLRGQHGDFAGVATETDAADFLKNCPSPAAFCGF